MKHNWSMSKTDLVWLCRWWARPDVQLPYSEPGEAAQAGTNGHKAIEDIRSIDADGFAALYGCDAEQAERVQKNLDRQIDALVDGYVCRQEVAFAYHPATDTARELPKKDGHRDYSDVRVDEIAGTLDLVGVGIRPVDGVRVGIVVDWKFGRQQGLKDPSEAGQLLIGALCLARVNDLDEVFVAYALPDAEGNLDVRPGNVDALDLAAFADSVRVAFEDIHADPQPQPGPWCKEKWCPARSVCPEAQAASEDVYAIAPVDARLPMVFSADAITCPQHALQLHTQIGLAEQWANAKLKEARAAVKEWLATNGPVEADDGSRLAIVQREGRETLDIDEQGAEILREALGDEARSVMTTTIHATKGGIDAATKKIAKGKARTALATSIFDGLRKAGNVRKGASYDVVDVIPATKRKAKAAE